MSRKGYRSHTRISSAAALRYAPLALALGFAISSHASNIVVDSPDAISEVGKCTIVDAVAALNTQAAVNGCIAGDGNNDTIDLTGFAVPTTISLTQAAPSSGYALPLLNKATFRGALGNGTPLVTIERSTVTGTANFGLIQSNYALALYGLTLTNGASGTYVGGAVVAGGTLTIGNCVISNNTSDSAGGGIAASGALTIDHSIITGNTAGNAGGGIEAGATTSVYDSLISNNMTLSSTGSGGGGVFASSTFRAHNTTFSGNTSASGGGAIFGSAAVNLNDSTINGNKAQNGPGGGIGGDSINLSESTVTGNSATGAGGAVQADMFTATYSTIAQNSSTSMSGGGADFTSGADAQGSILYGNTPDDLSTSSTLALGGNLNLVGTSAVATPSDTISCNPMLATLANNGGPTLTMALQTGSCAIDAAASTPSDTSDQRGFSRPAIVSTNADIGAYEFGASDPDKIFADGFDG
ncbi:MAG: choice-of-anchor Q domain-containing protein [Rudaea sp.]